MRNHTAVAAGVVVLAIRGISAAQAVPAPPTYSAAGIVTLDYGDPMLFPTPSAMPVDTGYVSQSGSFPGYAASGEYHAAAAENGLHLLTSATLSGGDGQHDDLIVTRAFASFTVHDVIFNSATTGSFQTAANFVLDGNFAATDVSSDPKASIAVPLSVTYTISDSGGNVVSSESVDIDSSGTTDIKTDPFTAVANEYYSVELDLGGQSYVYDQADVLASPISATEDFDHTLTFAPTVFDDVPAGVVVTALDAGIVANTYVATPEPTLAAGVLALGLLARRVRRHRGSRNS